MRLARSIAVLVAVGGGVACTSTTGTDAGVVLVADSGLACGPIDVTLSGFADGGVPETMRPPRAAHAGQCSAQQIADYAACQGAKQTALCPQFAPTGASAACGACIESQKAAPDGGPAASWGILVFNTSTGTASFDVEGCVDDALGQVGMEIANGGTTGSCGDLLHASYGCQEAACSACTGSPIDLCPPDALDASDEASDASDEASDASDEASDASAPIDASDAATCPRSDFAACAELTLSIDAQGCKHYGDAVDDPAGACGALFADAGPPPDVTSCFPDASIQDPNQQEVEWLGRIVLYMCGN